MAKNNEIVKEAQFALTEVNSTSLNANKYCEENGVYELKKMFWNLYKIKK